MSTLDRARAFMARQVAAEATARAQDGVTPVAHESIPYSDVEVIYTYNTTLQRTLSSDIKGYCEINHTLIDTTVNTPVSVPIVSACSCEISEISEIRVKNRPKSAFSPLAELPVPFGIDAEDWEHIAHLCDLVHEKPPPSIGSGIGASAIAAARRMHFETVPDEDLHDFAARFDQRARTGSAR